VKHLPSDYVLMGNEFPVIVGLDFGTSNSCISFWREDRDRVKIIKNDNPIQRKH
jgi:molecular chaperone DnaK (HSP70)